MTEFTPKYPYPRSVNGKDYYTPLRHPEVEAIGSRADCLYRKMPLTEDERDILLRSYKGLVRSDDFLSRRLWDQPILKTKLRPRFANDWSAVEDSAGKIEATSGFVWRVLEYVERLEARYAVCLVPVLVDDDI